MALRLGRVSYRPVYPVQALHIVLFKLYNTCYPSRDDSHQFLKIALHKWIFALVSARKSPWYIPVFLKIAGFGPVRSAFAFGPNKKKWVSYRPVYPSVYPPVQNTHPFRLLVLRCSVLQIGNSMRSLKITKRIGGTGAGVGRPTIEGASSKNNMTIFGHQISSSQFRCPKYGAKYHWLRQVTGLVKFGREST